MTSISRVEEGVLYPCIESLVSHLETATTYASYIPFVPNWYTGTLTQLLGEIQVGVGISEIVLQVVVKALKYQRLERFAIEQSCGVVLMGCKNITRSYVELYIPPFINNLLLYAYDMAKKEKIQQTLIATLKNTTGVFVETVLKVVRTVLALLKNAFQFFQDFLANHFHHLQKIGVYVQQTLAFCSYIPFVPNLITGPIRLFLSISQITVGNLDLLIQLAKHLFMGIALEKQSLERVSITLHSGLKNWCRSWVELHIPPFINNALLFAFDAALATIKPRDSFLTASQKAMSKFVLVIVKMIDISARCIYASGQNFISFCVSSRN